MRKHLTSIAIAAWLSLTSAGYAWAIKATPRPVNMKQPDGSTLLVRIHGDENFHYLTTTDGFAIQRDADGYFKYLTLDKASYVRMLTTQRAHNVGHRQAAELQFMTQLTPITSAQAALKMFPALGTAPRKAPQQLLDQKKIRNRRLLSGTTTQATESEYLVVLVKYADGTLNYTPADFERWLNEPGYAVDGGTGSVKDYYRDNSMGQFVPNFTVLGPYTLDHEKTYYAANNPETGSDVNPEAMVIEAVRKAKADHPELNFARFDNDGDGYMDNVNVIYSGYGEAASGDAHDMWPHSYRLSATNQEFQVDGITVNNYSVSAELVGGSGTKMDGIGTFTHEFGHILGLRDMYDTDDYTNGLGINPGDYSLYASGSYNNNSRTPPCLMAFERQQMGWMDLTPVAQAEDVELQPISQNVARYINAQPKLDLAKQGGDWYVLENRQQTGWDKYIPAHGLLIYHYDFTTESIQKYWSVNGPNNNARHRCLYIVPADGIDDDLTRKGDTYPGITGSTEFTDESHPEAVSWTGEKLRTPITNITEDADGLIHFQVKGGSGTRSFIRTVPPTDAQISSTSISVGAIITAKTQEVSEMGFCWSAENAFPTLSDSRATVTTADRTNYTLTDLQPATRYHIRAYMKMADGSIVYGASLPVSTEHATVQAPFSFDFTQWDGNEPERWRIIDHNGDGMTWTQDASAGAIVYQFDYWNNADDWLISEKMHVPQRGALYIVRGVMSAETVEKLDVCVSTRSRDINDFHLVKSLTMADHIGEQAVDEVDLSDYAGQDVYVALVAKSEKLQNSLWIWQVLLTNRLGTPSITDFSAIEGGLHLSWTPVEGATNYYLDFSEVTDEAKQTTQFIPESDIASATEGVETGTGTFKFAQTGRVETVEYPEGITGIKYLLFASGPRGTSVLSVEGYTDGGSWERIGELRRISANDTEGTAVDLSPFLKGKSYTRLRISCDYNGRLISLRNFTLAYNDGTVWKSLSAGRVENNEIDIKEKTAGEFQSGKRYAAEVFAGDGLLFYDASAPAFYQYGATGITQPTGQNAPHATKVARTLCRNGIVRLSGLTPGLPVTLYAADGRQLHRFVPTGRTAAIRIDGYAGVVIGKQ